MDILARSYHDAPMATQERLDYLLSQTTQQRAARQAMGRIAIDVMLAGRTVADIAAMGTALAWLPQPLPPDLAPHVGRLLAIAHSTKAALAVSSRYRQAQLLAQVAAQLTQGQRNMAGAKTWQATAYGRVRHHWLPLLQVARETLQAAAALPQDYLPGPPLEPTLAGQVFKGRADLFREIEQILLAPQPPTLLLYGGRRAGKTSTLNYLPHRLPSTWLVLPIDMQGIAMATSPAGFATNLVAQMRQQATAIHHLTLPPFQVEADPLPGLMHWLQRVTTAVSGQQFLLCLDEFERLEEIVAATGNRAILNFLRHLIQH